MVLVDTSSLVALVIGLLTFSLVKFWLKVRSYPPGPFTIPLIGSAFFYLKHKKDSTKAFQELKKRYNGLFTIWVGTKPFVIVSNWNHIKEGLVTRRNDIVSRPQFKSFRHGIKNTDALVFQANNQQWEVCRKVAYVAIRKFSDSEELALTIYRNSKLITDKWLNTKEPIDPLSDIRTLIFDVIQETAFGGDKLTAEDLKLMEGSSKLFHDYQMMSPAELSPLLIPFYYKVDDLIRYHAEGIGKFLRKKYQAAKKTYVAGTLRHFCDSVITSRLQAEEDDVDNDYKRYLTDDNMAKIMGDLFLAAKDTTKITMHWVLLALAQYPEIQKRVAKEIDEQIGNKMPLPADKDNCPYTLAFLSETLRYRAAVPMLIPHATNVDTEIGGHKLREGTTVIFSANDVHFDPELWEEPEEFKPERFLDDNGKFNSQKMPGFLAFGEGKRNCIGEKMGRNNLFLMVANIIQKLELSYHGPRSQRKMASQNSAFASLPEPFEINFKARK